MNTRSMFASLFVTWTMLGTAACSGPSQADTGGEAAGSTKELWRVTTGLAQPESAYYHAPSQTIYVSNVNGTPIEKDGDGYISKLKTDGTVVDLQWVTGLDAPKGLRAHGSTLWVADIDQVISIDIETGKITKRIPVEGATFLNDIATADDGTVYVADTLGNKIYRVQDGQVAEFAQEVDLESPNGLLVDGDRLLVGAWGPNPSPLDFSTEVPGRFYWLDLKSGAKTLITKEPLGNLDGVELDGSGGYLLTDFRKGQVLRVDAEGRSTVVLDIETMGAADHAYLPGEQLLVLPHMIDGYVLGLRVEAPHRG